MFHKASKSELKTWMFGDLILFIVIMFTSVSMFASYVEDTDTVKYLIWGLVFIAIAGLCLFFFYKMIMAFRSYEARMEVLEKEMEAERIAREKEEEERIKKEEEETKKFIEEYQKKLQEAEELRKQEQQNKGNK